MSAQLTLTTVIKSVPTLSGASRAVVEMATPLMAVSAQIITSVVLVGIHVISNVPTLLEASHVPVSVVTHWTLME